MHFLLLGATGRTGKHVVTELLAQGHTAVALVRNPSAVTGRKGLTVVQGSPLVKADVEKALTAAPAPLAVSAAIITLNTVRASDSPFAAQVSPPRFLADSCETACAALLAHGIRRVVVMSTAGAGDSWKGLPFVSRAFMGWTNIKYAVTDHNLVDKEIRQTETDWTLVRPMRLEYDDAAPAKDMNILDSVGGGKLGMRDYAHITSVARLLVKIAVEELYVKEAIVVRD
ncbi:hypothetical protein SCUCBS95973_004436 [Sporothrix curviconia]|uniref:NAD(P)-binding domain-containing protein n=1 Tax=Sporothrix curviconia TaxID=1260050 RepID=A0ABP0BP11_9PEZI